MTDQGQKVASQVTHFALDECSLLLFSLGVETVDRLNKQHGLRGDSLRQRDLLWRVRSLRTRFDDKQHANPLLLQIQRKDQEGLGARRHGAERRREWQLFYGSLN